MSNQKQVQTKTPPVHKDYWRTSDLAYADACLLCGVKSFDIDIAASYENKRCAYYLDESQNALSFPSWFTDGCIDKQTAWCNPPFSNKFAFLDKAYQQIKKHQNKLICMMIPYEPCTDWWRKYVHNKASIVYVPSGRYNFVHPETGEEIKGVNFASAFVVFTGLHIGTMYHHFQRGVSQQETKTND